AAVFTIITLAGFYIGKFVTIAVSAAEASHMTGQTMAFLILGFSSVIHIFNVRSNKKSIFKLGWMSNKSLFWCAMLSIGILFAVVLIKPAADIFYLVPISWAHWIIVILLSIIPLAVVEIQKHFLRRDDKRRIKGNG
ncbi:MAG: cation-translocating P-type ATPase C-terminal domain-containing protein, partial [Endomicrobia bacterium]|nr:cation-translocating P-type ATPase C-terminal domain-containing protein [Endomicrobiia bacterium]